MTYHHFLFVAAGRGSLLPFPVRGSADFVVHVRFQRAPSSFAADIANTGIFAGAVWAPRGRRLPAQAFAPRPPMGRIVALYVDGGADGRLIDGSFKILQLNFKMWNCGYIVVDFYWFNLW